MECPVDFMALTRCTVYTALCNDYGITQYTIYYRAVVVVVVVVVVCVGSKMGSIYHYHDCTRSISSEQDSAHLESSIIYYYIHSIMTRNGIPMLYPCRQHYSCSQISYLAAHVARSLVVTGSVTPTTVVHEVDM